MTGNFLGVIGIGALASLLAAIEHGLLSRFAQPAPTPVVRTAAPGFAGADAWLNTTAPLTPEMLRGQVVLVDFRTYCGSECVPRAAELAELAAKFQNEPVLIVGIHSGKGFDGDEAAWIRGDIERNRIAHPVAVDRDQDIWKAFGISSLPTLVIIDPEGYVVGQLAGSGHTGLIERVVQRLLAAQRDAGASQSP